MKRIVSVIALCLTAACACTAAGTIIHVDDDAPPGGDGRSWATAYRSLQDALQQGEPLPPEPPEDDPCEPGDPVVRAAVSALPDLTDRRPDTEIRVAQGVYKPDQGIRQNPGDRIATFRLASGAALKGGYAGLGASDPNARDIALYETVLSGDLAGNDVEVDDPCDLWREPSRSENAYHVVTTSGTHANTILEGFTITGGNAYEYDWHPQAPNIHNSGGGLRNDGGSPLVRACTFTHNVAEGHGGGGMCNRNGASPCVVDCQFIENTAREGGGVYNYRSEAFFENCLLTTNWTAAGGAAMVNVKSNIYCQNCTCRDNVASLSGGGIVNTESDAVIHSCLFGKNIAGNWAGAVGNGRSQVHIKNCTFEANTAGRNGGAVSIDSSLNTVIEDCSFNGNKATDGGAVYIQWSPEPGGADLDSPVIRNCIFAGGRATRGGAVQVNVAQVSVSNCTFAGNRAVQGGSLLAHHVNAEYLPSRVELSNNIFWDGGSALTTLDNSVISVRYCNILGGKAGVIDPCNAAVWGVGNLDADPSFADPGFWDPNRTPDDPSDDFFVQGDYHLKSQAGHYDTGLGMWITDDVTSPCIDAGDPNSPIGYEPFPNGGIVNMGAYGGTVEASKSYFSRPLCETPIAGDINGDCRVDFKDLVILLNHWLQIGERAEE